MSTPSLPHILVAYPKLFRCYSKFARKLDHLLSRSGEVNLIVLNDWHQWLEQYRSEREAATHISTIDQLEDITLTHAVLFDDGQELSELIDYCKQQQLNWRLIPIRLTRIVNVDRKEAHDVYIGRGSPWGNPYAVGFGMSPDEGQDDRDEAIRKFQYDFDRDYLNSKRTDYHQLIGKVLGCHCKPAACHGDVIVDYLNGVDDGL